MTKSKRTKPAGTKPATTTTTTIPVVPVAVDGDTTTTTSTVDVSAPLDVRGLFPDAPVDLRVPACIDSHVRGFRTIASMPIGTVAERRVAVAAYRSAAFPTDTTPRVIETFGPTATGKIMDTQNVIFIAAIAANVRLHCAHVAVSWAATFPTARCGRFHASTDCADVPYIATRVMMYPFAGTLSDAIMGTNGHSYTFVPGMRDLLRAWRNGIGRDGWAKPYVPPTTA